jgi:sulfatase maturation enzyme AslB (radical SAM superfamily)
MAFGKTFSGDLDFSKRGDALTFVVPAAACDLACRFCAIRQRKEAASTELGLSDYLAFFDAAIAQLNVCVVGIQGYEALLPDSWVYTRALLQAARDRGIRTTIVTNGTHLQDRFEALVELGVADITVSLDSADAKVHDALRGRAGTFAKVTNALAQIASRPKSEIEITVASILLPRKRRLLEGMYPLLRQLKINRHAVTPLLDLTDSKGRFVVQDNDTLIEDLYNLSDIAANHGVDFVVDDEFGNLVPGATNIERLAIHRLSQPNRLYRLSPAGVCSVGTEVLRPIGLASKAWRTNSETAAEYVQRIVPRRQRDTDLAQTSAYA